MPSNSIRFRWPALIATVVVALSCPPLHRPLLAQEASAPADDGQAPEGSAAAAAAPEGYALVWADEFNVDGPPNPEHWNYERGFVRNNEAQWYQPDNARCEEGLLIIEARREQVPNPRYEADSDDWRRNREFAEYTSTSMLTRGKHEWLYGRFEMRGRIDTRPGMWPAFWTLGSARGWPGCGEVDIAEYYSGVVLANACWAAGRRGRAEWDSMRIPLEDFPSDWSSQFHVWRMDWDPQTIKLYLDDQLLNTIDLSETVNATRDAANPFHESHYIILNLAIGGTQGGDPSETEFPGRYEVDYVRIYQRPQQQPAAPEEPSADAEITSDD